MAMGAMRGEVLRLIFSKTLRIAAISFDIGLPLSLAVWRLLRSHHCEVGSFDVGSVAAACVIRLAVSIYAAALPAHSATKRVDTNADRTAGLQIK